jgi:hypothetical protein
MTMRYQEFIDHLRKAHLTVGRFARLMGMNRISLSNYAKTDRVPSHLAIISALVGEMSERGIEFESLLLGLQVGKKKPRGAGIGKFGGDRQRRLF